MVPFCYLFLLSVFILWFPCYRSDYLGSWMTTCLGKSCSFGLSRVLSMYVFSYFHFGFEGGIWDLIVSVPDHCVSFYFAMGTLYSTGFQEFPALYNVPPVRKYPSTLFLYVIAVHISREGASWIGEFSVFLKSAHALLNAFKIRFKYEEMNGVRTRYSARNFLCNRILNSQSDFLNSLG